MSYTERTEQAKANQIERAKADPEKFYFAKLGFDAFYNNVAKSDCPFNQLGHAAHMWQAGWETAEWRFDHENCPDEEGCAEYARRFAPV